MRDILAGRVNDRHPRANRGDSRAGLEWLDAWLDNPGRVFYSRNDTWAVRLKSPFSTPAGGVLS